MRLDRLLSIVITLLNKDKISAQQLSNKYEVSVRTIYRDIEAINQAGIPIVAHPGNNGGFSITANYKIDRHVLTLKDMQSILLALKSIGSTFNNQEFDTAYHKIYNLVAKEQQNSLGLQHIEIDLLPWGYNQKHKQQLNDIHLAIRQQRFLKFCYSKPHTEPAKRTVEPMSLLFKGHSWYLAGYCLVKKDFRLFRVTRMSDIKIQDKTFVRRNISMEDFQDKQPGTLIDLELKFSPLVRSLVEEYYSAEQIKVNKDGSLVVKASFPESDWIYGNLLSFGENVEILKPVRLRKIIADKIQKMQKVYQT